MFHVITYIEHSGRSVQCCVVLSGYVYGRSSDISGRTYIDIYIYI